MDGRSFDDMAASVMQQEQAEAIADMVEALARQTSESLIAKALSEFVPRDLTPSDAAMVNGQARAAARAQVSEDIGATAAQLDKAISDAVQSLNEALAAKFAEAAGVARQAVGTSNDAIDAARQALEALTTVQGNANVAVDGARIAVDGVRRIEERLNAPAPIVPGTPLTSWIGEWKPGSYPTGTLCSSNGGIWLALEPTGAKEPQANGGPWIYVWPAFAGFVGAVSSKAMREAGNNIPFFTQDSTSPPDPKPGNSASVGGSALGHIKGWVQTDTMATFVAMDSGNGIWAWVETSRGGGGGGSGLPNPLLPNSALQTDATNEPGWSPVLSEGTF